MTTTISIKNDSCNEKCESCFLNFNGEVMSLEDILKIARESPDKVIEIQGGETMLYRDPSVKKIDIVDVILGIVRMGKDVHVSTNGTYIPRRLLEEEVINELQDHLQVQVSLWASNAELYKEITKRNVFNLVEKNISIYKENYDTVLSCAIYRKNYADVKNIADYAVNKLGLPIRFNLVMAIGKGKEVELITTSEVYDLLNTIRQLAPFAQSLHQKPMIFFGSYNLNPLSGMTENNCPAVTFAYNLPMTSAMSPCLMLTRKYHSPGKPAQLCEFFHQGLMEKVVLEAR